MRKTLDSILEQALQEALASLKGKAKDMVEEALGEALRAKVKVLLEEEAPTLGLTLEAPTRAKAKAARTVEATLAKEEKGEATLTPRKRRVQTALAPENDLESILESVKFALAKYSGATTPKGKPLPEVLFRRIRKTLEHAQTLGRADVPALARSAIAVIATDPMGVAMGSWQALASRLGLPIPIAQNQE